MTILTLEQLRGAWLTAGGAPEDADTAAAIAMAESGGNTAAILNTAYPNRPGYHEPAPGNLPEYSEGLWQVNIVANPGYIGLGLLTVSGNARAAVYLSGYGANFTPWSTYQSGAYEEFMPAAGQTGVIDPASAEQLASQYAPHSVAGWTDLTHALAVHLPARLTQSRRSRLAALRAIR